MLPSFNPWADFHKFLCQNAHFDVIVGNLNQMEPIACLSLVKYCFNPWFSPFRPPPYDSTSFHIVCCPTRIVTELLYNCTWMKGGRLLLPPKNKRKLYLPTLRTFLALVWYIINLHNFTYKRWMHKQTSSAFIYTYAKGIFLCQTLKKFSRCSQGSNPSPFTCETEAKCCSDHPYLELVKLLLIDRLDAIFYLLYLGVILAPRLCLVS